jgi:hypothetical protein
MQYTYKDCHQLLKIGASEIQSPGYQRFLTK